MKRLASLSPEQELIKDIFEPLTHVGHPPAPSLQHRSDKYFAKRPRKPLTFGLQDDAALAILPENKELVLSKDLLVEGVHFTGHEQPADIASKALRTNLSDIASKGASPYGYMLGLALTPTQDKQWLSGFAAGLQKDQKEFDIPLIGGDTVHTLGPLTISITILGLTEPGSYVSRDGAQIGDKLYISGTIGDAYLGLKIALNMAGLSKDDHEWMSDLSQSQAEFLLNRYQYPQPRIQITPEISKFCTSSMDVSDGLVIDAHSLCAASNLGAKIEVTKIPFSQGVSELTQNYSGLTEKLITGGDDYEILCTVPANLSAVFEQACRHKNVSLTQIGVIEGDECRFLGEDGLDIEFNTIGYSHINAPL